VQQCSGSGAELVVVRGGAVPPAIVARKSAANVKFVPAAPDTSLAELRALGASAAAGDVVIFVDEDASDATLPARLRAIASGAPGGVSRALNAERAEAIRAYLGEDPQASASDTTVGGVLPSAGASFSSFSL